MSDQDKSSKTEEATQKKKNEAFEKGNFAKTPDMGVVFVLAAAFGVIVFYGKEAAEKIAILTINIFDNLKYTDLTQQSAIHMLGQRITDVLIIIMPFISLCVLAAFTSGAIQSGLRLTPKTLEPNFDKLNPVTGFQKLFSPQSAVHTGMDILKFSAIGTVIYSALHEITKHPIFNAPVPIYVIGNFIYDTFLLMLARLIAALSVVAAISYIYQRFKVKKDLMMTKQEVKDEMKQYMTNPQIKSAQRAMARQILQKQMLNSVPTADVIVTNPTHFAVALKYESGKDPAPLVLAKGKNMFAQRIKAIAQEHGVPMVENKPVARMLYKVGRVGDIIPPALFKAVAEILSKVYQSHRYYFHKLRAKRAQLEAELKHATTD